LTGPSSEALGERLEVLVPLLPPEAAPEVPEGGLCLGGDDGIPKARNLLGSMREEGTVHPSGNPWSQAIKSGLSVRMAPDLCFPRGDLLASRRPSGKFFATQPAMTSSRRFSSSRSEFPIAGQ
jgi:hypothetical protein